MTYIEKPGKFDGRKRDCTGYIEDRAEPYWGVQRIGCYPCWRDKDCNWRSQRMDYGTGHMFKKRCTGYLRPSKTEMVKRILNALKKIIGKED